jgi:hypothetical protein
MTTLDGTKLTKNHIIFRHNNIDYTVNINGDERLNIFKRNLMNIYLEQFEDTIGNITYDDIIYISTLENHDRIINDLPNNLKGLFIMSSMCNEIVFNENVKQNIEFVSIDKTNINVFPNIYGCINLYSFKINHSNITDFNINYSLPNKLREFNLSNNNITNNQFSYNKLLELLEKNKMVKYSFSDNYLVYNLFPEKLQRKCNLLRQFTYKYNPISFRNVGQDNIRNFVNDIIDNDNADTNINNILNSSQTVHLSSVNKSVVNSVNNIKDFIKKHNITQTKLKNNTKLLNHNVLEIIINYFRRKGNYDDIIGCKTDQDLYDYFVYEYNVSIFCERYNGINSYINTRHSITELTYLETFELVWSVFCYLIRHDKTYDPNDLLERLYIELNDSIGYCYTGKYNRLINSLVGIIDGVYVGISSQEEIQMEFGRIVEKLNKNLPDYPYEKALCDAKEIFKNVGDDINKDDWLNALYDLEPSPIEINYNNIKYLQTWDELILDIHTKDILGVKQNNKIYFIE